MSEINYHDISPIIMDDVCDVTALEDDDLDYWASLFGDADDLEENHEVS